eukprot:IDg6840t1
MWAVLSSGRCSERKIDSKRSYVDFQLGRAISAAFSVGCTEVTGVSPAFARRRARQTQATRTNGTCRYTTRGERRKGEAPPGVQYSFVRLGSKPLIFNYRNKGKEIQTKRA